MGTQRESTVWLQTLDHAASDVRRGRITVALAEAPNALSGELLLHAKAAVSAITPTTEEIACANARAVPGQDLRVPGPLRHSQSHA